MDEYNKICWREKLLQDDSNFFSEEDFTKSHMQQALNSTLDVEEIQKECTFWDRRCHIPHAYPGQKYYMYEKCAEKNKSQFNTVEHLRLISALKVLQSGRVKLNKFELSDRELLNNSKANIQQENARFLKWAESSWLPSYNKSIRMNKELFDYTMTERRQKLLGVLKRKQFYVPVDLLPWCFTAGDISVEMVHFANILDLGSVSQYMPPILEEECFLDLKLLPKDTENYYSKLPISYDKNIDEFIQTGEADVAVSLSSLKKIFSYLDTTQLWTLPIVIKTVIRNNQKKKVILLDKPLPKQNISKVDLNTRCHKLLVRSNFCRLEGFRYPVQDKITSEQSQGARKEEAREVILHNAAYKLWTLKQENIENSVMLKNRTNKTFKVLVRSKIDACRPCEYGLQGVTVVPKLEYQLKFGGGAFSANEVMSQWTDLTFRPNSIVQRVRTQYLTSEVVKIDSANLASVSSEATHHGVKPHSAFVVFYKLLLALETHTDGCYLLRHNIKDGSFVSLLQSTDDANALNIFDLHKEYATQSVLLDPYHHPWTPIDTSVLLPAYDYHGHCPGLYKPCAVKVNNVNNFKGKGKLLQSKKRCFLGVKEIPLCGNRSEVFLPPDGVDSARIINLRPSDNYRYCAMTISVPPTHAIHLQILEDSARIKHKLFQSMALSCNLHIYLEDVMKPLWDGDLCSSEPLRSVEMLPTKVTIRWASSYDKLQTKGRKIIVTAVGRGEFCRSPGQHTCMKILGVDQPIYCVSADVTCDGHENCPAGSKTSDEDTFCESKQQLWVKQFMGTANKMPMLATTFRQYGIDNSTMLPKILTDLNNTWNSISQFTKMSTTVKPMHESQNYGSLHDLLAQYDPWGYLCLGVVLCGSMFLVCYGVWECCIRRYKPDASATPAPPTTVLIVNNYDENGAPPGQHTQQPPNYDDLDLPPSYIALFPNKPPDERHRPPANESERAELIAMDSINRGTPTVTANGNGNGAANSQ